MRRLFLSLLFFKSAIAFSQPGNNKVNYAKEPETNFEVFVNDKRYVIAESKELNLDTLIKPRIIVKQSDYKKFENASFSFEYPKHLAFEFEESMGINTWTLSGNSAVVLVFQMAGKGFLQSLVDEMADKFGKKNCKIENLEKKIGSKLYKGKQLRITLVGESLLYDCYELESNDLFSNYLFIQDGLDNMKHSVEYEKVIKQIDATITYK